MSASYGRSRSGNRFYNPPAVRRQLQLQQQQQLLLQKQNQDKMEEQEKHMEEELQQQQHDTHRTKGYAHLENRTESDYCASSTSTTNSSPAAPASTSAATPPSLSVAASSAPTNLSNLDWFLEHTTPLVPAQHFSKTSTRRWRAQENEFQPYFVLGDLWESFKEWSAYGAGVPLLLNGCDSVIQYYVPYLSGIQLYKDPSIPPPSTRRLGEESDAESSRASSDGSSDYETERGHVPFFQDLIEANGQGIQGLSLKSNSKPFNGSSSDEGDSSRSAGAGMLTFEYLEHEPPHFREPLADKISLLATRFPDLRTCRSCDLSPTSWVSVAWYPIYRIPTGPTLQNLDSCFLTFHYLSTPVHGTQNEWKNSCDSHPREVRSSYGTTSLKLPLPTFGLASYKFKAAFWDQKGVEGCLKANNLLQAADDFLRHLNVHHPDYNFFINHGPYYR